MKNPNWKEEELILVLNLYLEHDLKWLNSVSKKSEEIITMSSDLKQMKLFSEEDISLPGFRSPASVHMKLMNFKGLDPEYGKYGLRNGGQLDKVIWDNYAGDPVKLKSKVKEIRKKYLFNQNMNEEKLDSHQTAEGLISLLHKIKNNNETLLKILQDKRKNALNIEPLYMSQMILDVTYNLIMDLKQWDGAVSNTLININNGKSEKMNELGEESTKIKSRISDKNVDSDDHYYPQKKEKIGLLVQSSMKLLFDENKLDDQIISQLLNADWCKKQFHIGHPLLRKVNSDISLFKQMDDINGRRRYWVSTYHFNEQTYLLCKEWYEKNRKYFVNWYTELIKSNCLSKGKEFKSKILKFPFKDSKVKLTENLLSSILKKIKMLDEQDVYIDINKLNYMLIEEIKDDGYYENSENILRNIINLFQNIGLINLFKDTESGKYVIEDYEMFYEIINNPDLILNKLMK